MKAASSTMIGYLDDTCATLSTLLKLTSVVDQTILGFTNYTRNIKFEGVNYLASAGQTPTAMESNSALSVDNLDIHTIRNIDALTGPDILNGRWDLADMRLFLVNPNDLTAGDLKLRRGTVGKVSLTRQRITSEVRGMMEGLKKQILELYSPGCLVDLFSTRCGVRANPPLWTASTLVTVKPPFDAKLGSIVKPTVENGRYFQCTIEGTTGGTEPTWDTVIGNLTVDGGATWEAIQALTLTGTVTAISSTPKRVFRDSARTEPNDFWTGGLLTFTSGLNINRSMEVKLYTVLNGEFELMLPLAFAIAVTDAYSVQAGCFKRVIEDCRDKFDNTHNFQGHPYVQQNFEISPARIDTNAGGK